MAGSSDMDNNWFGSIYKYNASTERYIGMKEWIKYIILVIIITAWSYEEYIDYAYKTEQDERHNKFFTDMRGFTAVGERFTAQDGVELCKEFSNHGVLEHKLDPINCETFLEEKGE